MDGLSTVAFALGITALALSVAWWVKQRADRIDGYYYHSTEHHLRLCERIRELQEQVARIRLNPSQRSMELNDEIEFPSLKADDPAGYRLKVETLAPEELGFYDRATAEPHESAHRLAWSDWCDERAGHTGDVTVATEYRKRAEWLRSPFSWEYCYTQYMIRSLGVPARIFAGEPRGYVPYSPE